MRRYSSPYASSFSFGPGPISTALKALIGVNVVMFVAQSVFPITTELFGLHPAWVIPAPAIRPAEHVLWLWQVATYMFLHGGIFHIVFPIPAKIFVAIMGAIAFLSSMSEAGGVANATHLGGLLVGYVFLKSARMDPIAEVKYRYLKWKINRVRKKFDVYSGGRADDWDRRVH